MMRSLINQIRHLIRDESGSATIEFVMVVPVYISLLVMSVELGLVTMRHALLQRGLDIAIREVRLGTGEFADLPQDEFHNRIRQSVCNNSHFIRNCFGDLVLEMTPRNIRAFSAFDGDAECVDRTTDVDPSIKFEPGVENELVIVRACLAYDPLVPGALLGSALNANGSIQPRIIATTAFVQEPL